MADEPERWHALVAEEVDRGSERVWDVATSLRGAPETAFEEHRVADRLCTELAEGGSGCAGSRPRRWRTWSARSPRRWAGSPRPPERTADVERVRAPYGHFRDNDVLSSLFGEHLAALGIPLPNRSPVCSSGIGNVSTVVPAIHPFVAIVDADLSDLTPEFATAAEQRGSAVAQQDKSVEKTEDGHFVVISGRRWRATDPEIPEDVAAVLRKALMAARRDVGRALRSGGDPASARARVGIAKVALGERGTPWWEQTAEQRRRRWEDGVAELGG